MSDWIAEMYGLDRRHRWEFRLEFLCSLWHIECAVCGRQP